MMMNMVNDLIVAGLAFLGLCLGSFAGAQVWRLRARQLVQDKKVGEKIDKKEYARLKPLSEHTGKEDRSRCLSCNHRLAWYDLLPLLSWMSTGGKCRYCKAKIGLFEPLMELVVAIFFVVSYIIWAPHLQGVIPVIQFVIWLVAGVMLAILAAYDIKWFLLPDRVVFPLIVLSGIYALLTVLAAPSIFVAVFDLVGSLMIMSGIYWLLWLVSKGKWIGFGDIKLGIALGLLLGSWQLAFLALFLANLIGCLIVLPGLMMKKLTRTTKVPFGPMLIAGFLIAALFGADIISWYLSTTFPHML